MSVYLALRSSCFIISRDDKGSVVAFLKRFTSVSNSFIDDFFGLVDPAARKKDFVIHADAAAKWLGMTKGNLLKTR